MIIGKRKWDSVAFLCGSLRMQCPKPTKLSFPISSLDYQPLDHDYGPEKLYSIQ